MSQGQEDRSVTAVLPAAAGAPGGHAPSRTKGTLAAASLAVMVAQIANALPGALNGEFQLTFNTFGSQLTWITAAFMIPVVVFELTFGVLGDKIGHRKLVGGESGHDRFADVRHFADRSGHVGRLGDQRPRRGRHLPGLAGTGRGGCTDDAGARARHRDLGRLFVRRLGAVAAAAAECSPASAGGAERMPWWCYRRPVLLTALRRAEAKVARERRLDIWGQITFALGLILVLFGLVQGPQDGWTATAVVAALVAGTRPAGCLRGDRTAGGVPAAGAEAVPEPPVHHLLDRSRRGHVRLPRRLLLARACGSARSSTRTRCTSACCSCCCRAQRSS